MHMVWGFFLERTPGSVLAKEGELKQEEEKDKEPVSVSRRAGVKTRHLML